MKKIVPVLVLGGFLLVAAASCKDKEKDPAPAPAPEPVKTGKINFKITTYDSYGRVVNDDEGISIRLMEDNLLATTDSNGMASFENLPYGTHTPVLEKAGYDGPIVSVVLNSAEHNSFLPFARFCEIFPSNFTANSVGAGSVYVSYNNNPPPQDTIQVAVIGSTAPDLSQKKFMACEIFKVNAYKITDLEISQGPSFKTMLSGLDSGATFYVNVLPVSYGLYQGNLQQGPQLLGENQQYLQNLPLKKKWKN